MPPKNRSQTEPGYMSNPEKTYKILNRFVKKSIVRPNQERAAALQA